MVEFVLLDPETEQPTGVKRYNILHRNPLRIEYSELSAEGVKAPLTNGDVIKQQVKEAYEAWQKSSKVRWLEQTVLLNHDFLHRNAGDRIF